LWAFQTNVALVALTVCFGEAAGGGGTKRELEVLYHSFKR